jgi:hypothetical protein
MSKTHLGQTPVVKTPIVMGQYLIGMSFPQFNKPLNGLKEAVLDSPGITDTNILPTLFI